MLKNILNAYPCCGFCGTRLEVESEMAKCPECGIPSKVKKIEN